MNVLPPRVRTRRWRRTIQGQGVPTRTRAKRSTLEACQRGDDDSAGGLPCVSRSPWRSKGAALARFTPADGRRRSSDARGGDGSRQIGEKKEAGPRACVAFGLCGLRRGPAVSRPNPRAETDAESALSLKIYYGRPFSRKFLQTVARIHRFGFEERATVRQALPPRSQAGPRSSRRRSSPPGASA